MPIKKMSADFKASSFIVKRAKPSSYQQCMPTFLCFLSVDLYFNTSGLESVLRVLNQLR